MKRAVNRNIITRFLSLVIAISIAATLFVMPNIAARSITEVIADFGDPEHYTIFSPSKIGSTTSSNNVTMSTEIHMEGRASSMLWGVGATATASSGGQRFDFKNAGVTADWGAYSQMSIWLYSEKAVTFGIRIFKGASQTEGYWHYNLTTKGEGWENAVIPFNAFTAGGGMNTWDGLYSMQFTSKPTEAVLCFDSITLEGTEKMRLEGANPPPEFKYMSAGCAKVTLKLTDKVASVGSVTINPQAECVWNISGDKLILELDGLKEDTEYVLTVSGCVDSAGNSAEDIRYQFTTASYGLVAEKSRIVDGSITSQVMNTGSSAQEATLFAAAFDSNGNITDYDTDTQTVAGGSSVTFSARVNKSDDVQSFIITQTGALLRQDIFAAEQIYKEPQNQLGVKVDSLSGMGDTITVSGSTTAPYYPLIATAKNKKGDYLLIRAIQANPDGSFSYSGNVAALGAAGGEYTLSVSDAFGNLIASTPIYYISAAEKSDILQEINDGSETDILALLTEKKDIDEFSGLNENDRKDAARTLARNKPYQSFDEIAALVARTNSARAAVNAADRNNLSAILASYEKVIFVDRRVYDTMSAMNQQLFNDYVLSFVPFDRLSVLEEKFEHALKLYENGYFETAADEHYVLADFSNDANYTIFSPSSIGSSASSACVEKSHSVTYGEGTASMLWPAGSSVTASNGGQRFDFSKAGKISDWSGCTQLGMRVYSEKAATFSVRIYKAASQNDGYWHYNVSTAGKGWEEVVIPFSDFESSYGMSAWNELWAMQFASKSPAVDLYFDSLWLVGGPKISAANPYDGYAAMPVQNAYVEILTNHLISSYSRVSVTGDGKEISNLSAEKNGRRVSVLINDTLEYDTDYTLTISDCLDSYGGCGDIVYKFRTIPASINVSRPVIEQSGAVSVQVFNPGGQTGSVTLYAAAYNKKGAMTSFSKVTAAVAAQSDAVSAHITPDYAMGAFVLDENGNLLRGDIVNTSSGEIPVFRKEMAESAEVVLENVSCDKDAISISGFTDNPFIPITLFIRGVDGNEMLAVQLWADAAGAFCYEFEQTIGESGLYTVSVGGEDETIYFLNQTSRDALLETVNTGTRTQIETALKGVREMSALEGADDVSIAAAAELLYARRTYSDFESMLEMIEKAVYLFDSINTMKWTSVETIIKEYNSLLVDESDYIKYSNLTKYQTKICQDLVLKQPFASFEAFKAEFAKVVKAYPLTATNRVEGSTGAKPGGGIGTYGSTAKDDAQNRNQDMWEVFIDLNGYEWAHNSIYALYNIGAISPAEDYCFRPGRQVTREEFIKLLITTLGIAADPVDGVTFSDETAGEWYCKYVAAAKNVGLIMGKEDGSFGIGESITREDMAVMLYRGASIAGRALTGSQAVTFSDQDEISEYAVSAVTALAAAGIINGSDGRFYPRNSANRAEAAKIVAGLLQIAVSPAGTAGQTAKSGYASDRAKLEAFGVLDRQYAVKNSNAVSRGEFLTAAMGMLKEDGNIHNQTPPYSDIKPEDKLYGYAAAAYERGYIDSDTKFYPDKAITGGTAAQIISGILGYGALDEDNDFILLARHGISAGQTLRADGTVSEAMLYRLLLSALDSDMLVTNGNHSYSFNKDESLLNNVYNIYEKNGIVDSNRYTSLFRYSCGTDEITIDGEKYKTGDISADDFLGLNVDFYYRKDNDEFTLVYMAPAKNKNRIIELKPEDIEACTDADIEYVTDKGDIKKCKLSKAAISVYNGVAYGVDPVRIKPRAGKVVLIDNNNDNVYDVIKTEEYDTFEVLGKSVGRNSITAADIYTGNTVILNFEGYTEPCDVFVQSAGQAITIADVEKGDIISYLENMDGNIGIKKALVSKQRISGTRVSVTDDAVTISDESGQTASYRYIEPVREILNRAVIGTFYFDSFGAMVKVNATNLTVYGYLTELEVTYMGDANCRIFTENNRWVTLPFAGKVSIDNGNSKIDAREIKSYLGADYTVYRRLVTYKVNGDGEIIAINIAKKNEDMTYSQHESDIQSDVFRRYDVFNNTMYYSTANVIGDHIGVTDSTVIFAVPEANEKVFDSEDFYTMKRDKLINSTTYSGEAFDNDRTGNAGAVVLYNPPVMLANTPNSVGKMIVFTGIESILLDYEAHTALSGLCAGEEFVLPLNDETAARAQNLREGDIIQVTYNHQDIITGIDVKYDAAAGSKQMFLNQKYYSQYSFPAGRVASIDYENSRLLLEVGNEDYKYYGFNSGLQGVYLYNPTARRGVCVEETSVSDIRAGDYIVMSVRYCQAREIYIIRAE